MTLVIIVLLLFIVRNKSISDSGKVYVKLIKKRLISFNYTY